jgi:hypothetical protein
LGVGLTTPHRKKQACYETKHEASELDGFFGRRWVDNIKMDLREIGWDGGDWIDLAQDRDQWKALVKAVMNLRVP